MGGWDSGFCVWRQRQPIHQRHHLGAVSLGHAVELHQQGGFLVGHGVEVGGGNIEYLGDALHQPEGLFTPFSRPRRAVLARPSRRATQHRLAGTLDVFPPADAPFGHDGPALGANLGNFSYVWTFTSRAASGRNGHIYWLQTYDGSRTLFELDPYTGQLRAQSVPPGPTAISSIAVASDGSVLIADPGDFHSTSPPAGIWRFKDGVLSKLAGFDRPVPVTVVPFSIYSWPPSEDGKGGAATFSYKLCDFCAGPNDTF